ncbi:MAG: hypothetical protein QXV23_06575 [Candidatus Bathyarchaeia archaeon]
MAETTMERTLNITVIAVVVVIITIIIDAIQRILTGTRALTLTHLGSGNFKASSEERTVFEFMRDEPFTLSGYINLKNMVDGDTVVIREYIKTALDVDYTLYHEETYYGKQTTPILYISKRPAMKGIKITIQQTSGEPKYFQWEFYGGIVG